jgi:predicted nuclease with TOPRIM domain
MTNPQITTDLSEILKDINRKLDKIDERFDKVDEHFARLEERFTKLEINQVRLEEYTKGEFKSLNDKIDGLSKRVDSVEFTNRGIFVAVTIAVLGGFAKIFGFIGNANP